MNKMQSKLEFGTTVNLLILEEPSTSSLYPIRRSASIESTQSEQEFRKRHQAITHRMVHRKSSAVMYGKILERTFGKDVPTTK